MSRRTVMTDRAPAAIGPYSQAVASGDLVICSGQIPLDPVSGELVSGDIGAETRRVMDNLAAVLQAAGCGMADVLRCTIYLVDLADFGAVNEAYGAYFPQAPPARACVQVSALPKGARVEIDAIARRPG